MDVFETFVCEYIAIDETRIGKTTVHVHTMCAWLGYWFIMVLCIPVNCQ